MKYLVILLLILVLILPVMSPEPPPGDWVPPDMDWLIIFDGEYDQHPGKGGEKGVHNGWAVVVEKGIGWAK